MSLNNSLFKKLSILDEIESCEGAISPLQENELATIEKEIINSVDRIVHYRIGKKAETKQYKDLVQALADRNQNQLNNLDSFLKPILERCGKLQTPVCALALRSKLSKSIVIDDFDLVQKKYPEVVVVTTVDNKRTIALEKSKLKEISELEHEHYGFHIDRNETEYIESRVRVKK